MKNVTKKVLGVIVKAAEGQANVSQKDWPPPCVGYIHQPKRPNMKKISK